VYKFIYLHTKQLCIVAYLTQLITPNSTLVYSMSTAVRHSYKEFNENRVK